MTTHLDEITVYLHENRMEIKSKSSNRSIIVFDLDLEEPLLSEIKTCKEFWICYKRDVSFSDGQIDESGFAKDIMDIAIAGSEKSNLTSFVLNYTSGFVEKLKSHGHLLNNISHSDLIEYFDRILDDDEEF